MSRFLTISFVSHVNRITVIDNIVTLSDFVNNVIKTPAPRHVKNKIIINSTCYSNFI